MATDEQRALEAAQALKAAKLAELRALLPFLTQADVLGILGLYGDADKFGAEIAEAREQCDDDLEIDDVPLVSALEDGSGVWVAAWIWVATPEPEETEGDDD